MWLAFTGAEETDHAGLYVLLRDDPTRMRDAAFVGLEGLGSGRLTYLTEEGLCDHYSPDPGLLAAAERVGADRPELEVGPACMSRHRVWGVHGTRGAIRAGATRRSRPGRG